MDIGKEKGGHGNDLTVLEEAVFLIVTLFPPGTYPTRMPVTFSWHFLLFSIQRSPG